MSLIGKNKKIFSYCNDNKSGSNFMYKDFEKTKSYRTKFIGCNFNYVSFRAAKMKWCTFNDSSFKGAEFIGTNLRNCDFSNVKFEDVIFSSVIVEKTNFKNATFKNCYILSTNFSKAKNFSISNRGITIFENNIKQEEISQELCNIIENLRNNKFVRKSGVLHRKKRRLNTLSIYILLNRYSEQQLIYFLPRIGLEINKPFYTLSYIIMLLEKKIKNSII